MNPDENLPDEVRTRAYYSQPVWKRIVVIAAGPAVNLVLALILLYEVHDASSQWSYLARLEQTKRKARWITEVDATGLGAPAIQGEFVVIKEVQIRKADGQVGQD